MKRRWMPRGRQTPRGLIPPTGDTRQGQYPCLPTASDRAGSHRHRCAQPHTAGQESGAGNTASEATSQLRPHRKTGSQTMKAHLWSLGVRAKNTAKRMGISGPLEGLMESIGRALFPPPSHETLVPLPTGDRITLPPGCPNTYTYLAGLYEPELTRWWIHHLRKGMVVVDVGAYVGYYSIMASTLVGPTGEVISIEPSEDCYRYLVRNAASRKNIIPLQVAIASTPGWARLVGDHPISGRGAAVPAEDGHIPCMPLDSLLAGRRVDMVKLDIEGGEPLALQGMEQTVATNPHIILIWEYNLPKMRSRQLPPLALARTLRSLGITHVHCLERHGMAIPVHHLPSTSALLTLMAQPTPCTLFHQMDSRLAKKPLVLSG